MARLRHRRHGAIRWCVMLALPMVLAACHQAEIDQLHNELAATKTQLASETAKGAATAERGSQLEKVLATTQAELATTQDELRRVKQSPEYVYREALALADADSDEGDAKAIDALRRFRDQYPNDSLMPTASAKIDDLGRRIKDRANQLTRSQAEVKKLLTRCRALSKQARDIESDGVQFNYFGDLDMNSAVAASRRGNKLREDAESAKTRGLELVKTIPDPDGSLKEGLEQCDAA